MVSPYHHEWSSHVKDGYIGNIATFFSLLTWFWLCMTKVRYFYIYFEMTIVNKFISIFFMEQHWILGLHFYNASTVVISRAKSRFADSILVYRWSVKIALLLIECSFSMPLTRYFISQWLILYNLVHILFMILQHKKLIYSYKGILHHSVISREYCHMISLDYTNEM